MWWVLGAHAFVWCLPSAGSSVLHLHYFGHDKHMVLHDRASDSYSYTALRGPGCGVSIGWEGEYCNASVARRTAELLMSTHRPPRRWIDVEHVAATALRDPRPVPSPAALLRAPVPLPVRRTEQHHKLHAQYAFYTGPFRAALVIAADGLGHNGETFVVYNASYSHGIRRVVRCQNCMVGYLHFSCRVSGPQLVHARLSCEPDAQYLGRLHAAVRTTKKWGGGSAIDRLCHSHRPRSPPERSAMQQVILDTVLQQLQRLRHIWRSLDGIVLAGGVAYNLGLSAFISHALHVKVWTPPQPGDSTLGFGAIWAAQPPRSRAVVHLSGPPLPPQPPPWARGCRPFDPRHLAPLLRVGHSVQVMAGRQPIGLAQATGSEAPIPGHRTVVGCLPPPEVPVPHVLIATQNLRRAFDTPVPLEALSHTLLLRLHRPVRARLRVNRSHALVAAVPAGLDPSVDWLLEAAAAACAFPLLFCREVPPAASFSSFTAAASKWMPGAPHVVWHDRLCHAGGPGPGP